MLLPETTSQPSSSSESSLEKRLFSKGTRPLVRNSVKPKPGVDRLTCDSVPTKHILRSHHLKTAGLLVFRLDILLESEAGAT
jgi:hypothetical protein